jgi:hypothetical protein
LQGAGTDLLGVGEFATEAVPAVDGAGAGGDEQRPALILLQQTRRLERLALGQGVGAEVGDCRQLRRRRHDLAQQRIGRIAAPHPAYEAQGDAQPEQRIGLAGGWKEPRIEVQGARQRLRMA